VIRETMSRKKKESKRKKACRIIISPFAEKRNEYRCKANFQPKSVEAVKCCWETQSLDANEQTPTTKIPRGSKGATFAAQQKGGGKNWGGG